MTTTNSSSSLTHTWSQTIRPLLGDLMTQIREDKVPLVSAGVAFFIFVALIPTFVAALSIYGLVANPASIAAEVQPLVAQLPTEAQSLIINQLKTIAAQSNNSLGWGIAAAVIVALWSASSGTSHLLEAVNLAFDRKKADNFARKRVRALGFTLIFIVFGLATVTASALGLTSLNEWGWPEWAQTLGNLAIWLIIILVAALLIAAVYRWGTRGENPLWRWVTAGSLSAVTMWALATVGFQFYVSNFGNYSNTYGSLSAVVLVLLWLYLSAFAIVLGAELNSLLERRRQSRS